MTNLETLVPALRAQFPALSRRDAGREAVFFDGPAGTQVPQCVIDAIGDYLTKHNANHDGVFATSIESDQFLDQAHVAASDLVGCNDPDEVFFGANMTTLTLSLSRALAQDWKPGDEIILSGIEHDANYSPWIHAAKDAGVQVHIIDIDENDCTLRVEQYKDHLSQRTRLVAVGCASNAVGTVNPFKEICAMAREVGAFSFLDAVHYAPHDVLDVMDWGCDFLACSAYKFFGPHVGIMYGRRELLEAIRPYKLRPSPDALPGRWMTGTQNHECIAGTLAAIDYLASIGRQTSGEDSLGRRASLKSAYQAIRAYENSLCKTLIEGVQQIPAIKLWGITNPDDFDKRLPTIAITHASLTSKELATRLAAKGIYVWHGNYYALPLTERLGVEPDGMVRIGLVHYNTSEEVDWLLQCLKEISEA